MRTAAYVVTALAFCGGAHAQTNDTNWRSYAWVEDVGAPRAAGLGGAFVALADDASSVFVNPAGMATVEKTEIGAAVLSRGAGALPIGDRTSSRTGLGYVGGAGRIRSNLAVGAFVTEPHDVRIQLVPAPGAGEESGYLESTVTDAGAAVAWSPTRTVHLGLRVNVTHLRLEGRLDGTSPAPHAAGTASAENRVTGDFGLLLTPSEDLRLGIAYVQGARWKAERTASGAGSIRAVEYQVSSPSKLAAGLAYHLTSRLTVAGQADLVLLARLKDTFRVVREGLDASAYELENGVDFRAGAEASIPMEAGSVQLRIGVHSQAPAAFRYAGREPDSERSTFAGISRRTYATAGVGFTTRTLRLDVAGALGGLRTVLTAGAGVRF